MSEDNQGKTVHRSAISFEYASTTEHTNVVHLLRKAVLNKDLEALLELNARITDIKGA